ncbi:MAG: beta-lactamase family protein [Thermomicrobiales bacterium]|nr:beta-lactamase family protein [Thermomicrobiales bacterium]
MAEDDYTAQRQQVEQRLIVRGGAPAIPDREIPLAQRMDELGTPGLSIAVVEHGEIAWAQGYGVRRAGDGEPVTTETLFQSGSISKPVAALGVLRLVEQGVIELNADVNTYLRSWMVPPVDEWQPELTIRQLISHSAGLTVHGFPGYPEGSPLPTVPQILDGVAPANTGPVRVTIIPGTQFRYSGGGTTIVQQALEDVTRRAFPDLLHDLVLAPLGMTNSTYAQPLPEALHHQAAAGHRAGSQPVTGDRHVYPEMAAAGLWSTASDLARFAIGIMRAWNGEPNALLTQEMAQQMLSPILPTHRERGAVDAYIALGLFVNDDRDAPCFGHSGSDEGFSARLLGWPDAGRAVVAMVNGDWSDGATELIDDVFHTIATVHGWEAPASEFPPVEVVDPPRRDLDATWVLPSGFKLIALVRYGDLYLAPQGQPPMRLTRLNATTWSSEVLNTRVEQVIEDGQTTALILHQDGVAQRAVRKG